MNSLPSTTIQSGPAARLRASLVVVAVAALALVLLPGAPAADAARSASLSITPGEGQYTGGSRLTLSGTLGVSGSRAMVVQQNSNRVGDSWVDRPELNAGRSRSDGSFTVHVPAAAMWGISYRIRAGGRTTPSVTTRSRAQDVIVTQTSRGVVGQRLELLADTVGRGYAGYRELPAPVLPGRTLTLQRRVTPTVWEDVTSTTSDSAGLAVLTTTHRRAGDVYRVKAQDWRENGDDIGWTASFPHVVTSSPGRVKAGTFPANGRTLTSRATQPSTLKPVLASAARKKSSGARRHAHSSWNWWASTRYRHEWERGQSLDSGPMIGALRTHARTRWTEGSDGTGRVTVRNGGLLLRSDGYNSAPQGARGSVWATMAGRGDRLGRWEVRGATTPGRGNRHRVRYELVPTAQADQRCTTSSIVLAESQGPNLPMRFGVRASNGKKWGRTRAKTPAGAASYAVQVTKKHITWFVNGTPVGTLRKKVAVPKGPMTVRVTMVGRTDSTMASTKSTVDWVRGFSLKHGKRKTTKTTLKKGAAYGGC